ncbi:MULTISPECIES: TerB family tellurite resistance protein [Pseudomonas]|uniref:DnaJ domain-containing protein n=1 Tax=Pseudomonas quercus TaxID=2722792 RepID=A0ABX0YIN2_9PSED|nr:MULTISPECIES: TerB family tellurite resistance protein [Pseudomonas]MBF7144252.1 TerB family tellurite resistance protein [Pseudomonas sp. LY10J]NJP02792.1 DnaJ domain-containing protein [Pseudomonas quercus]
MLWPVTVVGAAAGFALAHIPGSILGALIGQAVDRRLEVYTWPQLWARMKGQPALPLNELLFVMLGRLAKVDGRVQESHIAQARHEMTRMSLNEGARKQAIAAFGRGKTGKDTLRGPLRRLQVQPATAEGLLRACWRMAWADGQLGQGEQRLLVEWGGWLGLTVPQVRALGADYAPASRTLASSTNAYHEALKVLGVTAATDGDQIKQAYRRLLSRHHPDKLQGKGASPAQVRSATERTRELHSAYDIVRKRRGL